MAIKSSALKLLTNAIATLHILITVIKISFLVTYLFVVHTKIIKFY